MYSQLKPAVLGILFAAISSAANPLQIKTDKGKVEGVFTSDQKVIAFKGIPFAAPPVGNLRWQPPQPAAPWTGMRFRQGVWLALLSVRVLRRHGVS